MTKDELVEKVAREIAPELEGGRMFDQMPPDRLSLRKWAREGMCGFNDATREDAVATARAALAIAMPAAFEIFGEAVKDGTCQCEACIDILVRELGEKWK